MGFSFFPTKIPKCLKITLLLLTQLVGFFKLMLMPHHHHHHQEQQSESPPENHTLLMADFSFVSVPVKTLTSFIKKTLPVMEYGHFLQRSAASNGTDVECCVCLERLEREHLMRELSNCCHVFHQHCLDCWIHYGQLTCPICRSLLFPAKSFTYKHLLLHHHD